MTLSLKIKHLRQSNKMSQSDLAKSLHVSYQAISNWERNKSYPDKENIIMISNLFNIPLDELMRDAQKGWSPSPIAELVESTFLHQVRLNK
ncbi:helix-turn-helix domain-containing protein [Pediococcus acidilactici]